MIVVKLETILRDLNTSLEDAGKCESGNKSAARRLRIQCMEAIKQLKILRSAILENSKK